MVTCFEQAGSKIIPLVGFDLGICGCVGYPRSNANPEMSPARLHIPRNGVYPGDGVGNEMVLAVFKSTRAGDARTSAQRNHCDVSIIQARETDAAINIASIASRSSGGRSRRAAIECVKRSR